MAVEVYISSASGSRGVTGFDYPQEAWELASFFSGSAHFSIIDSYSSVVGRYTGDPIFGGSPVWASKSDIGEANDWFIIESIGSTAASMQWQAKIQWTDGTAFDDPSGEDYNYEGQTGKLLIRFAPHGGWNTTSLDFEPTGYPTNPTYRASPNYQFWLGSYYVADNRWYLVADTGQFTRFSRENVSPMFIGNFGGFYGDITPVDPVSQPMPRVAILPHVQDNSLNQIENGSGVLTGDNYTAGWDSTGGGVAFQNATYGWSGTAYRQPTGTRLINYLTQYNKFDSTPKIDMLPYYVLSDTHGMIGTLSIIARGFGPGFMLVDNKNWLATRYGYGCIFKWDGSTDLDI